MKLTISMGWREAFILATIGYVISILTILFSLPDKNTVYGSNDCLQVLAEREIAHAVENSKYKKWLSYDRD